MGAKTGLECKLYRNTGTWDIPVWNEIGNVRDLTQSLEKAMADVSTRGATWRRHKSGLKDASIDFQMVWDTDDDDFTAIQEAFLNGTTIELAAMDGDIAVAGAEGFRSDFEVSTFSRPEPLEDAVLVDVTVVPAYTIQTPYWHTST